MPITRDRLRELVNTVPEDRLDEAGAALALLAVPDDDEPTTADDLADAAETRAALTRGDTVPGDAVRREFGW